MAGGEAEGTRTVCNPTLVHHLGWMRGSKEGRDRDQGQSIILTKSFIKQIVKLGWKQEKKRKN